MRVFRSHDEMTKLLATTCFRHGKNGPTEVQRLVRFSMKNGFHPGVHEKHGLYVGNWENDVKQGKGKKIYKNKTIYEGDWLANKRHGYGVLTKKVDDIYIFVYEGKWINNRFAEGKWYEDCGIYDGCFSTTGTRTKCGYGIMRWNNGAVYCGHWRDNKFNGRGQYIEANGNVYDGQWCKGLKHGEGLYVFKEKGQYMEGVWIQGVPRVGVIKHLRHKRDVNEVVTIPHTLPKISESNEECIRAAYEREKSETLKHAYEQLVSL
ncbi:MORN repeat-containing protein 3-like [Sipha flava]|nr:MORN repeat-containing protein 3-like [Sipha flava]